MTDIVTRLRTWVHAVDAVSASDLMDEAADEIERLRSLSWNGDFPTPDNAARPDNEERLAALQALTDLDEELGVPRRTPDPPSTPGEGTSQGVCTLTDGERVAWQLVHDGERLREEIARLRLTGEERHSIAVVRNCAIARASRSLTQSDAEREATLVLWRLLERLG